jgi:hypothetical protein
MPNRFFVTVKGKGKVHPKTGHEGPKGEQRYSSTLSLTSALDGDRWSSPRPGRFVLGKESAPTVLEAGWAPGPVWTGTENLAPTEIRFPDCPARSQSLHRLRYPGHLCNCTYSKALGVCVLHIADCTTHIRLKTTHFHPYRIWDFTAGSIYITVSKHATTCILADRYQNARCQTCENRGLSLLHSTGMYVQTIAKISGNDVADRNDISCEYCSSVNFKFSRHLVQLHLSSRS